MKRLFTFVLTFFFSVAVFATEYSVTYQINVTNPCNGNVYTIQSQTGSFMTGSSFTVGAATLPTDLANWQSLYDALVGSEFGIDAGALNENITIGINLMDFNCAVNGQYNNPDLFMFLGISVVTDGGVITPINEFFHFNPGKYAYIKIPRSNALNALFTALNLSYTNIAFGYYVAGLYTSAGLHFELTPTHVNLYLSHFSKFGGGRGSIVSVEEENIAGLPQSFDLSQNYPNPFNPTTKIRYSITESGIVSLRVYSVNGEEITNLVDTYKTPGIYEVTFNAENLPSGVYVYKLTQNNKSLSKKMSLIK
ncbi:MAG TPA: T9SS type A sorting domain-containing protein [Melioribacteraceae bacterium]|nr:T9SS type A sorting domain-containing protein [Melioribacteraceae bacterium]